MREHTEKLNPARALWVPFELGRPMGAPDDAAFQRRVLAAALDLFARSEGPVLDAFPDDAPDAGNGSGDMSGWVCPVNLAPPRDAGDADGPLGALMTEIDQLHPWYQAGLERRGRTQVGLSGLEIDAAARFLAAFVDDPSTAFPGQDMSVTQGLKFAADDIKAWYIEAATARPGPAGSTELHDWFWQETAAGDVLLRLSAACQAADAAGLQNLGEKGLVPRSHQHLVP